MSTSSSSSGAGVAGGNNADNEDEGRTPGSSGNSTTLFKTSLENEDIKLLMSNAELSFNKARYHLAEFIEECRSGKVKLNDDLEKGQLAQLIEKWRKGPEKLAALDIDYFFGMKVNHERLLYLNGINKSFESYLSAAMTSRSTLMHIKFKLTAEPPPDDGHLICLVSNAGCRWAKDMPNHMKTGIYLVEKNTDKETADEFREILAGRIVYVFDHPDQ